MADHAAAGRQVARYGNFMEEVYGFAQAVRHGQTVHVSGQTAMKDDGSVEGAGDMAAQMRQAYRGLRRARAELGASPADVVEETLFVTEIMAAATVAREVRKEFYPPDFPVASTLVEVRALGTPDLLIEIKCTAQL